MNIWKRYGKSSVALVIACLALFAAMPMASAQEKSGSVSVVPITDTVGGLTYSQLSAQWWVRESKLNTPTALDDCTLMNTPLGTVFFLAGTTGVTLPATKPRPCPVPSDKAIMFPVFNVEWSQDEAQNQKKLHGSTSSCVISNDINGHLITGTDAAALSACATTQAQHATLPGARLAADVDGVMLQDLTKFRAVSTPFEFDLVKHNPFCRALTSPLKCPLTNNPAAADGFWIILNPLSPGKHTIHIAATVPFPEIDFTFKTEVTYILTVQPQK
jgi:hypothetical protein